jgi:NAD(P)-dependent dehydrogenase (short-subunit alcohol dehydrogenase family)
MSKPTAIVVGVGAERGLGAALCRRFAQGGCHVLIAGQRDRQLLELLRREFAAGRSIQGLARKITAAAPHNFGKVDKHLRRLKAREGEGRQAEGRNV